MVKCKEGFRKVRDRCVKKKTSTSLKTKRKKSLFGLEQKQRLGLLLMALAFVVWFFRPFKECPFSFNILGWLGCSAGATATAPIFLLIMIVLLIAGVVYLFKLDKFLFGLMT